MPITISGSTGIAGVDGSASTPAVQGTDTNTGIFFPAADTIAFGEGGSEAMRIDSSGNVGIGTSSPAARMDVRGSIYAANTASAYVAINHDGINGSVVNNTGQMLFYANGANNIILHTNGSERMRIDSSGNFLFNSGYGSVATAYGCRAWVNFNGTGTVAIRGSGNVTSITDNGTGDYLVNFTNAMPDVNYSAQTAVSHAGGVTRSVDAEVANFTTGAVAIVCGYASSTYDASTVCVAIFR